MLIIRLVKAFPVLYTFPLLKSKWSERSLLFKKIANQVRRFCTCRHEHITTQFIRQRWLTLSAHFRKDNFNNKRFGTPFGKWKHCKALMFLQPYLNHEIKAKANSTVDPTNTNSAVESMEVEDFSSVDTFFASMAEQARRLSHVQSLQLQKRCQEALCEIEASDKPAQVFGSSTTRQ